ncbi:MAG TPA: hypothetical protein VGQ24_07540 [Gemmatimonadales bacterium]|nr:hypothetical protein [Gemmatimonadales bacterium]
MRRVALLCLGLVVGAASAAEAQLTMQMSNGWSFTFAGNVNAFLLYDDVNDAGVDPLGGKGAAGIRTGLLPAFAVFDAKGKEGSTDLGVHFGFAPQIQCGYNAPAAGGAATGGASVGGQGHDCFGAQIDMRQVYLTVGGSWGQILAGRELGLFGRQNILNDQTLFGVGATGGAAGQGTTLGRIGFGYIYPNFKAQMTYSSAPGRPFNFSIGLFQPAQNPPFLTVQIPRVEAEGVWTSGNNKVWVGGTAQTNKTDETTGVSETGFSWGGTGGVRVGSPMFSVTGTAYYGKGIGNILMFLGGATGTGAGGSDDLRKSYGGYGQITVTPANSKVTVAGSFGGSLQENANSEPDFKTKNWLASGGIYFQATKSLKVVGEFNYAITADDVAATEDIKEIAPAFGLMLFF